jgi:Cu/Ag efflux pump CusA
MFYFRVSFNLMSLGGLALAIPGKGLGGGSHLV